MFFKKQFLIRMSIIESIRSKFLIIICISVCLFSLKASAQNNNTAEMAITFSIPAVALINFEGTGHLITLNSNNQVEQILSPFSENETWLNYSSIVESGSTNYITVHISSGNLPAESSISLKIGEELGRGAGKTGTPSAEVKLSRYPQNIITDIGSCYTGRGKEKGHQLIYSWNNLNNNDKNFSAKFDNIITVTYTITSTE